jgi:transcriptional regulator with XRE-family HTH domain
MTVAREALGRAISDVRQESDVTQAKLGELTGLGQTAVSRIESGDRRVEATELFTIAAALNVEAAALIERARAGEELATSGVDDASSYSIVALRRLEKIDPDAARHLTWVSDFLLRFEALRESVDDA